MKLKLKSKKIKNLNNKAKDLPAQQTPAVAGGFDSAVNCYSTPLNWKCVLL
ncbi:hypothetical protein [Pseudoalteromonas phenolica]|uniref:hypothetical protein n=1 Tax=Pseudoalteromonas phenolica TaxID=161398 RepID=UPI0013EE69DF|nr:hypothetical protein [Pseudoalteromonas phenolica]